MLEFGNCRMCTAEIVNPFEFWGSFLMFVVGVLLWQTFENVVLLASVRSREISGKALPGSGCFHVELGPPFHHSETWICGTW